MGFGIWDWDGNGIWDWDGIWDWGGIMTNGWDGMGMGWDLTPMGIGILPFPLVWVASIGRTYLVAVLSKNLG